MKIGFRRKQKKNTFLNINNKKQLKSYSKPIFPNKQKKQENQNLESPLRIFKNEIPKKSSMILINKNKKVGRKRYGTFQSTKKLTNLEDISKLSEIKNFGSFKNSSNQIHNFGIEKKSLNNFGKFQKNSLNNFGNFQKPVKRNYSRVSDVNFNIKINLKTDINSKINIIQDLRKNNEFIKKISNEKIEEFLKKIKFDIKSKIFDKIVKSSLHFIYKHYENCQKSKNSNQILFTNLRKQKENFEISKNELNLLKNENEILEKKFLKKINESGLLKKNKEIISNLNKNDVLSKIESLKNSNETLKKKIEQTNQNKGHEIYKIKCNYEKKGREEMKAKAIILALKHVDQNNFEHFEISEKVKFLLRNLEEKSQIFDNMPYQKLLMKKEKLIKKLNNLKNN